MAEQTSLLDLPEEEEVELFTHEDYVGIDEPIDAGMYAIAGSARNLESAMTPQTKVDNLGKAFLSGVTLNNYDYTPDDMWSAEGVVKMIGEAVPFYLLWQTGALLGSNAVAAINYGAKAKQVQKGLVLGNRAKYAAGRIQKDAKALRDSAETFIPQVGIEAGLWTGLDPRFEGTEGFKEALLYTTLGQSLGTGLKLAGMNPTNEYFKKTIDLQKGAETLETAVFSGRDIFTTPERWVLESNYNEAATNIIKTVDEIDAMQTSTADYINQATAALLHSDEVDNLIFQTGNNILKFDKGKMSIIQNSDLIRKQYLDDLNKVIPEKEQAWKRTVGDDSEELAAFNAMNKQEQTLFLDTIDDSLTDSFQSYKVPLKGADVITTLEELGLDKNLLYSAKLRPFIQNQMDYMNNIWAKEKEVDKLVKAAIKELKENPGTQPILIDASETLYTDPLSLLLAPIKTNDSFFIPGTKNLTKFWNKIEDTKLRIHQQLVKEKINIPATLFQLTPDLKKPVNLTDTDMKGIQERFNTFTGTLANKAQAGTLTKTERRIYLRDQNHAHQISPYYLYGNKYEWGKVIKVGEDEYFSTPLEIAGFINRETGELQNIPSPEWTKFTNSAVAGRTFEFKAVSGQMDFLDFRGADRKISRRGIVGGTKGTTFGKPSIPFPPGRVVETINTQIKPDGGYQIYYDAVNQRYLAPEEPREFLKSPEQIVKEEFIKSQAWRTAAYKIVVDTIVQKRKAPKDYFVLTQYNKQLKDAKWVANAQAHYVTLDKGFKLIQDMKQTNSHALLYNAVQFGELDRQVGELATQTLKKPKTFKQRKVKSRDDFVPPIKPFEQPKPVTLKEIETRSADKLIPPFEGLTSVEQKIAIEATNRQQLSQLNKKIRQLVIDTQMDKVFLHNRLKSLGYTSPIIQAGSHLTPQKSLTNILDIDLKTLKVTNKYKKKSMKEILKELEPNITKQDLSTLRAGLEQDMFSLFTWLDRTYRKKFGLGTGSLNREWIAELEIDELQKIGLTTHELDRLATKKVSYGPLSAKELKEKTIEKNRKAITSEKVKTLEEEGLEPPTNQEYYAKYRRPPLGNTLMERLHYKLPWDKLDDKGLKTLENFNYFISDAWDGASISSKDFIEKISKDPRYTKPLMEFDPETLKDLDAIGHVHLGTIGDKQGATIIKDIQKVSTRKETFKPVVTKQVAKNWTAATPEQNPQTLYIFADNRKGTGTGPRSGSAVIRNSKTYNVIGIVTKESPRKVYTDKNYDEVGKLLKQRFEVIDRYMETGNFSNIEYVSLGTERGKIVNSGNTKKLYKLFRDAEAKLESYKKQTFKKPATEELQDNSVFFDAFLLSDEVRNLHEGLTPPVILVPSNKFTMTHRVLDPKLYDKKGLKVIEELKGLHGVNANFPVKPKDMKFIRDNKKTVAIDNTLNIHLKQNKEQYNRMLKDNKIKLPETPLTPGETFTPSTKAPVAPAHLGKKVSKELIGHQHQYANIETTFTNAFKKTISQEDFVKLNKKSKETSVRKNAQTINYLFYKLAEWDANYGQGNLNGDYINNILRKVTKKLKLTNLPDTGTAVNPATKQWAANIISKLDTYSMAAQLGIGQTKNYTELLKKIKQKKALFALLGDNADNITGYNGKRIQQLYTSLKKDLTNLHKYGKQTRAFDTASEANLDNIITGITGLHTMMGSSHFAADSAKRLIRAGVNRLKDQEKILTGSKKPSVHKPLNVDQQKLQQDMQQMIAGFNRAGNSGIPKHPSLFKYADFTKPQTKQYLEVEWDTIIDNSDDWFRDIDPNAVGSTTNMMANTGNLNSFKSRYNSAINPEEKIKIKTQFKEHLLQNEEDYIVIASELNMLEKTPTQVYYMLRAARGIDTDIGKLTTYTSLIEHVNDLNILSRKYNLENPDITQTPSHQFIKDKTQEATTDKDKLKGPDDDLTGGGASGGGGGGNVSDPNRVTALLKSAKDKTLGSSSTLVNFLFRSTDKTINKIANNFNMTELHGLADDMLNAKASFNNFLRFSAIKYDDAGKVIDRIGQSKESLQWIANQPGRYIAVKRAGIKKYGTELEFYNNVAKPGDDLLHSINEKIDTLEIALDRNWYQLVQDNGWWKPAIMQNGVKLDYDINGLTYSEWSRRTLSPDSHLRDINIIEAHNTHFKNKVDQMNDMALEEINKIINPELRTYVDSVYNTFEDLRVFTNNKKELANEAAAALKERYHRFEYVERIATPKRAGYFPKTFDGNMDIYITAKKFDDQGQLGRFTERKMIGQAADEADMTRIVTAWVKEQNASKSGYDLLSANMEFHPAGSFHDGPDITKTFQTGTQDNVRTYMDVSTAKLKDKILGGDYKDLDNIVPYISQNAKHRVGTTIQAPRKSAEEAIQIYAHNAAKEAFFAEPLVLTDLAYQMSKQKLDTTAAEFFVKYADANLGRTSNLERSMNATVNSLMQVIGKIPGARNILSKYNMMPGQARFRKLVAGITSMSSMVALGFNPATALLQLTIVGTNVLPLVGAPRLIRAIKDVKNVDIKSGARYDDLRYIYESLELNTIKNEGTVNNIWNNPHQRMIPKKDEVFAQTRKERAFAPLAGGKTTYMKEKLSAIRDFSMVMFNTGDGYSRKITAIAAYDEALDMMKAIQSKRKRYGAAFDNKPENYLKFKEKRMWITLKKLGLQDTVGDVGSQQVRDVAIDYAKRLTNDTNHIYNASHVPLGFSETTLKPFLQFKTWVQKQSEFYLNIAFDTPKGLSVAQRYEDLMYVTAAMTALGGVTSLPGTQELDAYMRWAFGVSPKGMLMEHDSPWMDVLTSGLFAGTGVSLEGRMGPGNLTTTVDKENLLGIVPARLFKSYKAWDDGNPERAINYVLPKFMQNLRQGYTLMNTGKLNSSYDSGLLLDYNKMDNNKYYGALIKTLGFESMAENRYRNLKFALLDKSRHTGKERKAVLAHINDLIDEGQVDEAFDLARDYNLDIAEVKKHYKTKRLQPDYENLSISYSKQNPVIEEKLNRLKEIMDKL